MQCSFLRAVQHTGVKEFNQVVHHLLLPCGRAMPSMATSHGGILYYVVKVPKEEAAIHQHHEPWSPGQRSFEEKQLAATSTPLLQHQRWEYSINV